MKDLQIRTRALSSLISDLDKKYDFNHPLQRQSGQWNKLMMSKLIDSAIRLYPIYPALLDDNGSGKFGVIDGKQRLTIFRDFFKNGFALHKSLAPVEIDEVSYEIAGKKFEKLDEAVQKRFRDREFQLYIMNNATEDDIREIFSRFNSSKGLNNTQRRTALENETLTKVVFDLKSHPVFDKLLSPAQRRKDLDKDIIRQVLMLTEISNNYDFGSFRNDDMNKFIIMYNENINYEKIETIKEAMNALNEAFESISINRVTIPILLYGYYRIIKDKKGMQKWNDWVKNFLETYETNEEYKQYCNGAGTASAEMVKGRLQYFRDAIREL